MNVEHYGTNRALIHHFGVTQGDRHHRLVVQERYKDDGTVLTSLTWDGEPVMDLPGWLAPITRKQIEQAIAAVSGVWP